uniref:Uncharacterized protein n=1 Tax=Brassica oleracea TaxID=3712 RepID=A0A3P6E6S0_BRAOL|nr:unnamed protein product [Brassica oleracea]
MTLNVLDITPVPMQKRKTPNLFDWCKDYVNNRRDHVAESSLLRVETHVVDDVSDYDIAPVNPPNDEYVSDGDMNSPRVPPPMPPGATGPASMTPGATGPALNHAASSSRSNSYPQMTLNAMLNSPARLAQPHLHPDKINGALWFGIDPCVNSFIRATWQAYYMGPWKSWRKVPDERRESWWQTFVMVASGTNERPSFTDLVRATHTRPDGTFVNYRAEELVTQAELEATQLSNTDESPGSPSASSTPSRLKINKAYLKKAFIKIVFCYVQQNAKGKRGHVYGPGSAQYREQAPSSRVPNGLARNLELDMRVGGLETSLQSVREDVSEVKQDVSEMKQDFASTRDAINQLLKMLRPPQAPTEQTSAQPQAPTPQP